MVSLTLTLFPNLSQFTIQKLHFGNKVMQLKKEEASYPSKNSRHINTQKIWDKNWNSVTHFITSTLCEKTHCTKELPQNQKCFTETRALCRPCVYLILCVA